MVVLLPGRGRGRRRPTHLEDMFPPICLVDQNVLRYTAKSLSPDLIHGDRVSMSSSVPKLAFVGQRLQGHAAVLRCPT